MSSKVFRCVCTSVCVNHELVHAINHYLFKLGPYNWDRRGKIPRSLLLWGWLIWVFKTKFIMPGLSNRVLTTTRLNTFEVCGFCC